MKEAEARNFVERVGEFFARLGHQRTAGRILGWLLICDPPEQSGPDIVAVTGASKASVSINLRLLTASGVVESVGLPGERRTFYRLRPAAWTQDMGAKVAQIKELRQIAEAGLDLLAKAPPPARERLVAMRDFYAFFERELPAVVDRWLQSQKRRKRK